MYIKIIYTKSGMSLKRLNENAGVAGDLKKKAPITGREAS